MTSLNGKTYKVIGENQLCCATGQERLIVNILSRDITYADNQTTFKRMLISNCLDRRHYVEEESKSSAVEPDLKATTDVSTPINT